MGLLTGRTRLPPVPIGPITRALSVYAIGYLVVESLVGPSSQAGQAFGLLGFLPVSGVTAWLFLRASQAAASPIARRGFGGYAFSFGAICLGTATTAWQRFHLGVDPTYSWANLAFLASYPAAMIGVLAFRVGRPSSLLRWRMLIDSAIAVAAAVVVTWLYVILPKAGVPDSPIERVIVFAYPIGDLVLFAALVPVLLAPRPPAAAALLRLLAAGQLIYLIGDLGYQFSPPPIPWLPFEWPDLVDLVGYLGLAMAAEAYWRAPITDLSTARGGEAAVLRHNWLPILLGSVVYLLLLVVTSRPWLVPLSPLAITVVFVTLLILVRERLTERQTVRLARALEAERSTTRFRAAIAHLRVGIVILGPDGTQRLANPAAVEMLRSGGASAGSGLFDPAWSMVTEAGEPIAGDAHPAARSLATGLGVRDVVIGIQPPGVVRRRWLLVDADPVLNDGGGVEEIVVSFHDITERRLLEAQLRHTQRMEAVGKLAGGIAHDFNNLLTAIIGRSDLLEARLSHDQSLLEDVAGIRQAADRAAGLTRQLLAFSRRQRLVAGIYDVNDVVRDTARLFQRLLGEDIAIELNLAVEPLKVRVDRGQLGQVVVNLALNARDAMPRGGHLTITTRHLDEYPAGIGTAAPGEAGLAVLQIRDIGEGMDERTRTRAFEPFFTTKEVGKGTGLGLATVYGIVQQSDGEVTIDSEIGLGTSVTVYLPATKEPLTEAPPVAPLATLEPDGPRSVLVVEDDPAVREVLRRTLAGRGFRVFEADGSVAAKAILESVDSIDLLLTDVIMPDGNGPALAALAKELRPSLPVLLMTGHSDDATLRYDLDPKTSDILEKPFDPDQLVARIAALLRQP